MLLLVQPSLGLEGPLPCEKAQGPPAAADMRLAQAGSAVDQPAPSGSEDNDSVKVKLYDLELLNQDGRKLRFKSDVIDDKVVVIIPFYTTCTTTYPILIFMLTRLQEMLGEHLGRDVVLVSVSVEPKTDTPLRLEAYARRLKARPGWELLSGDRDSLGQVLWGVGVLYSANIEEHNHIPVTLVGSTRSGWKRFHGFPSPEQVLAEVKRSLATGSGP